MAFIIFMGCYRSFSHASDPPSIFKQQGKFTSQQNNRSGSSIDFSLCGPKPGYSQAQTKVYATPDLLFFFLMDGINRRAPVWLPRQSYRLMAASPSRAED